MCFFPTCQVRVVRFYVSLDLLLFLLLLLPSSYCDDVCSVLRDLHCDRGRPVLHVGPQLHRTSTANVCSDCYGTSSLFQVVCFSELALPHTMILLLETALQGSGLRNILRLWCVRLSALMFIPKHLLLTLKYASRLSGTPITEDLTLGAHHAVSS